MFHNKMNGIQKIMKKPGFPALFQRLLNMPFLVWVVAGFFISYLFFFIQPIFLSSNIMQFPQYIKIMTPIGGDLQQYLGFSTAWFVNRTSPYIGTNIYPPLESVFFVPLLYVKFSVAYKIILLLDVLSYTLLTLVLPLLISKARRVTSLIVLVFISGLASYGFQFELERGQFNLIAVLFCFFAIWIYHYHNRYRLVSYLLFILSVQLKIYPFIFIVMLVSDWHDWKNNLIRFLVLTALNFGLFFILGLRVFLDFLNGLTAKSISPLNWISNHSIRSFIDLVSKYASDHGWGWFQQYSGALQIILLAMVAGCIFLIILHAYHQKQTGLNPFLLLACVIGASLIPSISHDYKLSLLAGPVAVVLSEISSYSERTRRLHRFVFFNLPVLIFSTVYASTLFSYTNKPLLLQNNCPALLILLFATAFLCFFLAPGSKTKNRRIGEKVKP
jgi:hypothetical protein